MREKILIIFGAGASYDSVRLDVFDDWTLRPPLATELFAANRPLFTQYIDRFPAIRSIIGELRLVSEDGKLLERELERFQLEAEKDERRHLRDAGEVRGPRIIGDHARGDAIQQWQIQESQGPCKIDTAIMRDVFFRHPASLWEQFTRVWVYQYKGMLARLIE